MTTQVVIRGSGRHIHLSEADLHVLFGPDAELGIVHYLGDGTSGMFLADKKVKLIGPKGEAIASVLGPYRKQTQIELSYTEARALGMRPPLSDSGKLAGTDPIVIEGPVGRLELKEGAMVVRRHIHMVTGDREALGVKDGDMVSVHIEGDRELIFNKVLVRADDKNKRSVMHIDFDEMNAAGLQKETMGTVYARVTL